MRLQYTVNSPASQRHLLFRTKIGWRAARQTERAQCRLSSCVPRLRIPGLTAVPAWLVAGGIISQRTLGSCTAGVHHRALASALGNISVQASDLGQAAHELHRNANSK